MNTNHSNSEKGQAIVYLVLGLVVFLGFVALAIDGGMVLADRRNAQNAADAASLAGGGEAADILAQLDCPEFFTCASNIENHAEDAAIIRAGKNGFTIDHGITDNNGVIADCHPGAFPADSYLDVTVDISKNSQSNFLQLVFPQALKNEVGAVTRVYAPGPIGTDAAVVSLNPAPCSSTDGIVVTGNGTITVNGGGIFSNGCIQGGGTPASALVNDGNIESHYNDPQNTSFTPNIDTTAETIDWREFYIPPPELDSSGNCVPGSGVHIVNSLPKDMTGGGLYCLKGSDTVTQDTIGTNITIYLSGNSHLTVNAGAVVSMTADINSDAFPQIPHVLIYAAQGASITLNGDSNDEFNGLIYAPDSPSQITLNGNADNVFNGQVIGWNIKLNGSNTMTVNYEACNGYISPPTIYLYK